MAVNNLTEKIHQIKLIITDVDGVLTDGTIIISNNGTEMKKFHVEDGMGVALARLAEIQIAFLSGRHSEATTIRAKELQIEYCYQGQLNKTTGFLEICSNYQTDPEEVCYIGDGLVDIPPMEIAGLAVAVPNAHSLTKKTADHVTENSGGTGVLAEVVEWILTGQGRYDKALNTMKNEVYNR